MRKKIYTADEQIGNGIWFELFFTLLWYSELLGHIVSGGFQSSLLIFLAAGLLVPVQMVRRIQKAIYFRKFHRQCVEQSVPRKGRIVNITREYFDEYRNNKRYRTAYYYLIVEVVDPETGVEYRIKSEPYLLPVYKYLGAPYVQVYTDQTGWKYVIDGFQLKTNRREPDIPLEESNVYLKDFNQPSVLGKWITLIVMGLILFQILKGFLPG